MRVTVKLFAGLRERAGAGERSVVLSDSASVSDVWPALDLGDEPGGLAYAVNKVYVERGHALSDGDEVAVIPPVSGGSFRLSAEPIDLGAVVDAVRNPRAGAIATFVGTTRSESRGRTVLHLDYEAYEGMAEDELQRIAADLRARYDLCAVAITHRVGRVAVGETSVAIAVSAPHRADALSACRDAIEALKTSAPIWKKEVYEGGEEWIGRGS